MTSDEELERKLEIAAAGVREQVKDSTNELSRRLTVLEAAYVSKDDLRAHYLSWGKMLGVLAVVATAYMYITPRVIAYESKDIDIKLDRLIAYITSRKETSRVKQ